MNEILQRLQQIQATELTKLETTINNILSELTSLEQCITILANTSQKSLENAINEIKQELLSLHENAVSKMIKESESQLNSIASKHQQELRNILENIQSQDQQMLSHLVPQMIQERQELTYLIKQTYKDQQKQMIQPYKAPLLLMICMGGVGLFSVLTCLTVLFNLMSWGKSLLLLMIPLIVTILIMTIVYQFIKNNQTQE